MLQKSQTQYCERCFTHQNSFSITHQQRFHSCHDVTFFQKGISHFLQLHEVVSATLATVFWTSIVVASLRNHIQVQDWAFIDTSMRTLTRGPVDCWFDSQLRSICKFLPTPFPEPNPNKMYEINTFDISSQQLDRICFTTIYTQKRGPASVRTTQAALAAFWSWAMMQRVEQSHFYSACMKCMLALSHRTDTPTTIL